MLTCTLDEITGDADVLKDGRSVGGASFANGAQRRLFLEMIEAGARPARAAEESGAIFLPR